MNKIELNLHLINILFSFLKPKLNDELMCLLAIYFAVFIVENILKKSFECINQAIDILKSFKVLIPDAVEGVSLFLLPIYLIYFIIYSNLVKKIFKIPTNLPLLMRSISEIVLDLKMQGKKHTDML